MSRKNKKRKLVDEDQATTDFEEETFFSEELKEEMESMWEIPQIFHFLHLTKEVLNISHLTIYEMERMLLIPRASKQLANIMTSLLSCPMTKTKQRKIPPMPYEFWTNILMHKMKSWFKLYHGKHKDVVKVLETIGIEPEFWNVFPDASILDDKDFEDLSFKQRVWLLKTICDTVMHTRKTIQEEMAKQTCENHAEMNLGTDRHGARYIYFPQFIDTELRIYRHCINNKVLSTVQPFKPKTTLESVTKSKVQNLLNGKIKRNRKRKSRWQNGLSSKAKKRIKKRVAEDSFICNCCTNSAIDLPASEDTNFSCTSSHSQNHNNNNNNNNNDINLCTPNKNTSRELSKTSEESTISSDSRCSNTESSSYGTSISNNGQLINNTPQESTFKGFSKATNEKHDITVINEILNRLETEVDIKCNNSHSTIEEETGIKNDINSSENESSERCLDNLSNNSKTDDEKLSEIIEIESALLKDKTLSSNSKDIDDLGSVSSISKSDDEKLNETKTSITDKINEILNGSPNAVNKCNMAPKKELSNNTDIKDKKDNENIVNKNVPKANQIQTCMRRSLRNKTSLRVQRKLYRNDDNKIIDSRMNTEGKTDLKNRNETTAFKKMLKDLGISNFRLVVDNVEALRQLISSFSSNKIDSTNSNNDALESHPLCEVMLVTKLTELLNSVKTFETTLKDITRKAKSKLQKEWTNFKEGSMEDQDSSGENGLSSNWWILGSQGYSLANSGDATLQTLPKSPLSPVDTQDCTQQSECKNQEQCTSDEKNECEGRKDKEQDAKSSDGEQEIGRINEGQEYKERKEGEKIEYDTKEEGQQTRRVLRARGVSSYTEQLYSDEEIYENELDKWSDIEAVYTAPSTQTCPSTTHSSSKIGHNDDWTEEEDSDQDWILPSSRKRKNKRPSTNKRLKALAQRMLNAKTNMCQDVLQQSKLNRNVKNCNNDCNKEMQECQSKKSMCQAFNDPGISRTSTLNKIKYPQIQYDSVRTVSSIEAVKIGYVDSVHSELDIKDEGPILDSVPGQYRNDCNTNGINYLVQQNPAVIGISQQNTFIQQNSVISGIMPSFQQNYYMREVQDYVVYDQQSSFIPLQQPIIQQVPCIVTSQQFVNHSTYSPCLLNATKPQSHSLNSQPLNCQTENVNLIVPVQSNNIINKISQQKASTSQSDSTTIKHNLTQECALNLQSQQAKLNLNTGSSKEKTTSLIVLSDSDDDIEIIAEKIDTNINTEKSTTNQKDEISSVVADNVMNTSKISIPKEIMQRINHNDVSITPIKPTPIQNAATQLVVVVNETGNYYALALPNGSKLILTPEQVAQIRASNGGKLIL